MRKHFRYLLPLLAILMLLSASACTPEKDEETPVATGDFAVATTEEVQAALDGDTTVVVDARDNNAFIGWALDGVERGGHIEGAVDFSAVWLSIEGEDDEAQTAIDDQLAAALETKGIADASSAIVYDAGAGDEAATVATYLKDAGVAEVKLYDVTEWTADSALPMVAYPNYELIVPASYVKDVVDAGDEDTKIFEVNWGEESDEYKTAHIPGAVHINTDEVEEAPVWNRIADDRLQEFALANGVTTKTNVILYANGMDSMAAYRVQAIMKYMGVDDVRVLNGGMAAWNRAGYETEEGSNPKVAVADFGATVPVRDDYIIDMPEAKALLADTTGSSLVDIRTWEEHIGATPGYSDITEAGRPAGSRWGGNVPDDFRNVDGTMRAFDEVLAKWAEWGITPDQDLAFFCGTGWRAAEVLIYADVAGLDNIALYDGGWYEWIMRGDNPKETGEPVKP